MRVLEPDVVTPAPDGNPWNRPSLDAGLHGLGACYRLYGTQDGDWITIAVATDDQFRAQRRGKFRWSGLHVLGTDALGLITMRKHYTTTTAEMTVFPRPIPVSIEIPMASGWGISSCATLSAPRS